MGAITTARAVETPFAIDVADPEMATASCSLSRFPICNPLAGVFGDLFMTLKSFRGKAAFAIDW